MTQATNKFLAFVIWIGLFETSIAQPNTIQSIDTVVLESIQSEHFKIRLPKVSNIESYRILFKNYGTFSEIEIDSFTQQFVGDYANIQRAKAINQKIAKQGIEPTVITYFKLPDFPVIEVAVSQEAITGEMQNKSLAFSRKVANTEVAISDELDLDEAVNIESTLVETDTNVNIDHPNNLEAQKEIVVAKEKSSDILPDTNKPKEKKSKQEPDTTQTPKLEKSEIKRKDSISAIPKRQLPENGDFVLLLPLVDNPEVYQFVLKDLGYVKSIEVAEGKWMYYLGFFGSDAEAQSFIPKLNERGFLKEMQVVDVANVQEEAQQIYNQNIVVTVAKTKASDIKPQKQKTKKVVDLSKEYYRIELPPVDNPEIFFKAFEDIGNTHSEIAPNGKAIYYIGVFESSENALQQLKDLAPRGLANGSIIFFKGDLRINPYRKDQIETKNVLKDNLEEQIILENEPIIKTNPKGKFRVELGQVDNPEVFKDVFGDIGKIKVGYYEDESEYFYLGNYYLQEDASFVAKQLKERGLSKVRIINSVSQSEVEAKQGVVETSLKEAIPISKPLPASVNTISDTLSKQIDIPLNENTTQKIIKNTTYKIWLGALENPKFYANILKDFGSLSDTTKDNTTIYYLESYVSVAVAKLVIEQIRALGIETPLKIVAFDE